MWPRSSGPRADRFPDNTLLSHDLIEGEHVRAGLVTDLEMIDDYPARYQAYSKRKHRWVRGDWQIAMWLLPRVPDARWKWVRESAAAGLALEDLRQSAPQPGGACVTSRLSVAPGCGWAPQSVAGDARDPGALLFFPIYADVAISLFRLPPLRFLRPWAWTRFSDFRAGAWRGAAHCWCSCPRRRLLMADAIARTLYRRIVSHRNLLEWESMAQAEMSTGAASSAADLRRPARCGAHGRGLELARALSGYRR